MTNDRNRFDVLQFETALSCGIAVSKNRPQNVIPEFYPLTTCGHKFNRASIELLRRIKSNPRLVWRPYRNVGRKEPFEFVVPYFSHSSFEIFACLKIFLINPFAMSPR